MTKPLPPLSADAVHDALPVVKDRLGATTHWGDQAVAAVVIAQRIENLLQSIERADREPDYWERGHLLDALAHLQARDFTEATASLILADRREDLRTRFGVRADAAFVSSTMLRSALARILQGGGE